MSGAAGRRRSWPLVVGVATAAALVLAHTGARAAGPSVEGALLVADHLYRLALVAGFLVLLGATGAALQGAAGLRPPSRLTGGVEAVAVGAGAWALLYLALGAVGLLHPVLVGLTVPAGAGLLRGRLRRVRTAVRAAWEDWVGPSDDSAEGEDAWLRWAALGVSGLVGAFLLVQALAPPTAWDALMYHLEVPRAFLEAGRIHLPPDNLHAAYAGLAHMLYLPLIVLGGDPAPALLAAVLTLLIAPVLLDLGRRHLGGGSGALAAAGLWGVTAFLLVTADTRVDGVLALFLVLAHGAVLDALSGSAEGGAPLRRAGLLVGLAFAVKYNAALYGLLLVPLAGIALRRVPIGGAGGGAGRARLRVAGTALLLALVAAAPWAAKNQVLLGAPLYPYGAERVLPPWMAEAVGQRAYPETEREIRGVIAQARRPLNLRDLLLQPDRLSPEPETRFFRLPFLLLLVPLGLLARRRREWALLLLPAAVYVAVLGVWRPRMNLRYLLPAAPALILCAGVGAAAVGRRARPALRGALYVTLLALSLAPAARIGAARLLADGTPAHALGLRSPVAHLAGTLPTHLRMIGLVEEAVPPEGRVLLLFEARGRHFTREVLQDNVSVNWPLVVETGLAEGCLEGTGVTHVLVGTGPLRFYRYRGADVSVLRWDRFEGFRERCLEPVVREPVFELYRVREAPAAPPQSSRSPSS